MPLRSMYKRQRNQRRFGGGARASQLGSDVRPTCQRLSRFIYNGLRDTVLWFGAIGSKNLDFLNVATVGGFWDNGK